MKKELIGLDWLTINYLVEDSILKGGDVQTSLFTYKVENYTTRQFRYVYYVYDSIGREVASIVCVPLSHIIDSRLHQVKLSNWVLYNPSAKDVLLSIKKDIYGKFSGISRVDICCDMNEFDFNGFMYRYRRGEIREKRPKNVAEYYKKIDNKEVYTGVSWGSKISDWTAKIYDKIREIKEESGKRYILDYFTANEINIDTEKVWRYEFSICNFPKEFRDDDEIIEVNDENIFDFKLICKILSYYTNLHAFSTNTGKKRFIDEKRINIITCVLQEIPPKRVRSSRETRGIYSAKITINTGIKLLEYQDKVKAFVTYTNILQTAKEYDITEWLIQKHGDKLRKIYLDKCFITYGVGVVETTPIDLFENKTKIKKI